MNYFKELKVWEKFNQFDEGTASKQVIDLMLKLE